MNLKNDNQDLPCIDSLVKWTEDLITITDPDNKHKYVNTNALENLFSQLGLPKDADK